MIELKQNIDFTNDEFSGKEFIIIKFGSENCPPCRQLDSELPTLAAKNKEIAQVFKVDIDQNPDIMADAINKGLISPFMSIPTTFVFKKGNLLGNSITGVNLNEIQNRIDLNI